MESPELRKVSHIGLWIFVVIIGGYLIYSATHTSTENNKYAPNSNPTDIKHEGFRLVDEVKLFNFSCAREGLDQHKPEVKK